MIRTDTVLITSFFADFFYRQVMTWLLVAMILVTTTDKKQTNNHPENRKFQTAEVSTLLLSVPLAVNGTTMD